ncbi:hypothetical protein CHUAL_013841 [Chamberlinius hualienensis]
MALLLPLYAYFALIPLSIALGFLLLLRVIMRKVVTCKSEERLDGKTVVITGGNSGIGHAVSVDLAKRGAKVILACKDRARRDSAPFSVRSRSGNTNVRFMYLDLNSLDSIVEFCHQLCESEPRLDILINNAAVLTPKDHTVDGFDQTMGVNYFGHFLLTNLLLDKLASSGSCPRVINMLCDAYHTGRLDLEDPDLLPFSERDYELYRAYCSSKLALLIITKEMAQRFQRRGINVYAVNPGFVDTKIYRNWPGKMGKIYRGIARLVYMSPEDGSQSVIYAAISKDLDIDSGKCVADCKASEASVFSKIDTLYGEKLWDKSESLLKSKGYGLILKDDEE